MLNWIVGSPRSLFFFTILAFLVIFSSSMVAGNDWIQSQSFDIYGIDVQVYFSPEPNSAIDLDEVKGIINVTRVTSDYILFIKVLSFQTIQDNRSIYANELGLDILINTSIDSYIETIPFETPTIGTFTTLMVVTFFWGNYESALYNETVQLAASYQKLGASIDLAAIVIPGGFGVLLVGTLFVASRRSRPKEFDMDSINTKLEHINGTFSGYFTRGDEFKELEKPQNSLKPRPGDLSLLVQRKEVIKDRLIKLEDKLVEIEDIGLILEEVEKPVLGNDLFRFISSYFIRASRKRGNYPSGENVGERVKKIRLSLQEGRWDDFEDPSNIILAWSVCNRFVDKDMESSTSRDFDIEREAKELALAIRRCLETKRDTQWPSDRILTVKSNEDLTIELASINSFLNNFKKSNKDIKRKYLRKCSELKTETEKSIRWLRSIEAAVDEGIIRKTSIRLRKLNQLIVQELELLKKLKSTSKY
ncbi:MAG: hypothetical protein ACFFE8_13970 [Candidatus Heimdallarchaeota archaeon]